MFDFNSCFTGGNKFVLGGIKYNSHSIQLVEFQNTINKPLLIIAKDIESEQQIITEINFYNPNVEILHFANYEILPYDNNAPHVDIISSRIHTLSTLQQKKQEKNIVIITTLEAIFARIPPLEFINSHSFSLKTGEELDIEKFSQKLINNGYLRVDKVIDNGEFSIKGGVIDVLITGQKNAFRIDLFDNEIEDIKIFDVKTQLSTQKIDSINILPAKEFEFTTDSKQLFLTQHFELFNNKHDEMYQSIANGISPVGIEFYLPLFFNNTNTLFDYVQEDSIVCYENGISNLATDLINTFAASYANAEQNLNKKVLKTSHIFLAKEEFFSHLNNFKQFVWQTNKIENGTNFNVKNIPPVEIHNRSLQKLTQFLTTTKQKTLISLGSLSRLNLLQELLDVDITQLNSFAEFKQSTNRYNIIVSDVTSGFCLDGIAIVTEKNIFGVNAHTQKKRKRAKHKDFNESVKNIIEINTGDSVVHENYGVGRYLGLVTKKFDSIENDFIEIEYDKKAKLLIPIDEITLLSRYAGGIDNPPLHRLGTQNWNKAKKKAIEEMRDIASELLKIYAQREMEVGFAINQPSSAYSEFVTNFAFEETPDQTVASEEILTDMLSDKPMDRLICGDVGFGKTEIAMRAAFLAVENNAQVAILTPTTLLANQHYETLRERFNGFAVNIEVLSRFQSQKNQQHTKELLKNGQIDIVVGTHKLLQNSMVYKNLGLVIIDEEHRFGVSQKEKLKGIRTKSNILTMSATPIPRTLNLTLGSLRDMSIISTPPKGRMAVQTFVNKFDAKIIKEACSRELHRGGQIFFVHNDIDSIDNMAEIIAGLILGVDIRIAHGQMPSAELEIIMSDFYHNKFQILVCTTIIETGIDIGSANTIIINNADNFGLSQLHQLRGRVGRSHHKAYAYLLIKSFENLTKNARKRLESIESLEELGSGFMLANHDLEIRGAGDILGKNQSGKISEIGFNLYYELLDRTIKSLKNNQKLDLHATQKPTIDLGVSCIIPSDYIFDTHTRLEFYQKIAQAEDITDIKNELIDRFGLLPESCNNLFAKKELENFAIRIKINSINAFHDRVLITFGATVAIDFAKIITLIQTQTETYKLKDKTTLVHYYKDLKDNSRIQTIQKLLENIAI